jgi:hypothetical protein
MMSFLQSRRGLTRNDGVFSRADRRIGVTVAGIQDIEDIKVGSVFSIICRISLGTDK